MPPTGPAERLGLIVAVGPDGVIGRGGGQPWHVPEDLAFFGSTTRGHALVVGRRTFEAIGRPLPERRLVVVTSRPRLVPPEWRTVEPAPTVESAVAAARRTDPLPIVAGGAGVYAAALADVTDLWWTDLDLADLSRNDGDVVMPEPQ